MTIPPGVPHDVIAMPRVPNDRAVDEVPVDEVPAHGYDDRDAPTVPNDRAVYEVPIDEAPAQVYDDQDVPPMPMVVRPIDDDQHEVVGDPVPVAANDSNGGVRRSTRERRSYKKYEKSAVEQKQPGGGREDI